MAPTRSLRYGDRPRTLATAEASGRDITLTPIVERPCRLRAMLLLPHGTEGDVAVELNHTIVAARDAEATATFLTDLLGLPAPTRFGPFQVVTLDNGVSLDVLETTDDIVPQHYAFLVDEPDFDAIFTRIQDWGLPYWADPGKRRAGEINRNDGGRGVYFPDPDEHVLEIITVPYGG